MEIHFLPHNTHLENEQAFQHRDPHLKQLSTLPLVHRPALIGRLPRKVTGIFTLSGGRQVGKTTLLKQWMAHLMEKGTAPGAIAYLTGELIDDHHRLVRLVTETLDNMPSNAERYLIIDEVSYIRQWDKGVKYMADAGMLEDTVLMLTGSDMAIIKDSRMRFPGRRGSSDIVDFHLYPLNFYETVRLKNILTDEELAMSGHQSGTESDDVLKQLGEAFEAYLLHGGFLTAMNDVARHKRILPATLATYSDWIRGDVLKRNRNESVLREIVEAVIRRYGSQITWNNLASELSIDHPKTVMDYVELMVSMDAVYIQPAIREDTLTAAPKKAKKVMFTDPFIYHALTNWLHPMDKPYDQSHRRLKQDQEWTSKLVEACTVTLFRRVYPTFYIKAAGEVDIAYVSRDRFWPVEIKWTRQLRPKALKQIAKYPQAKILTKSHVQSTIGGIPAEPLVSALYRLGSLERAKQPGA